nr:hypothetical protein [Tanacetum cinerariifolium]
VGDFKSLAKEADSSLAKHKHLELEIEHLLKAVVSQDIISVVQNASIVVPSDLQTELEQFQVFNYAKENAHLKATYKNLFDSISVSRAQNVTKIASLQNELQCHIYKNTKLRTQLFKKVSDEKADTQDTSKNTKFEKQPIVKILPKIGETNALSKPVTSNSVSTPQVSKGVNNAKVIAPGMFKISPDKVSQEAKKVPNTVSASSRTKPITVSQPSVITKKGMNSNSNVVCGICKKCLISVNHDECLVNYVNGKKSRGRKHKAKTQKVYRPKVSKSKNVGTCESLATPKTRKPRFLLRWSPTGKMFDSAGKLVAPNGDIACTYNTMEPKIKRFPNSTSLLGRLSRFVYGASTQVVPST